MADRFFTTELPGKSNLLHFNVKCFLCLEMEPTLSSYFIYWFTNSFIRHLCAQWSEAKAGDALSRILQWLSSSPTLDCILSPWIQGKEIRPVIPKGNGPWIFIGRIDAEVGAPILWPPEMRNWHIGKNLGAGKDYRQEEKWWGMTEDEMVGWHHRFNGHESVQTPGDSKGQGSLGCCSPWHCRELDMV